MILRAFRDWLLSLDDDELARCRFIRRNAVPQDDREAHRVTPADTDDQRLRKIGRMGR